MVVVVVRKAGRSVEVGGDGLLSHVTTPCLVTPRQRGGGASGGGGHVGRGGGAGEGTERDVVHGLSPVSGRLHRRRLLRLGHVQRAGSAQGRGRGGRGHGHSGRRVGHAGGRRAARGADGGRGVRRPRHGRGADRAPQSRAPLTRGRGPAEAAEAGPRGQGHVGAVHGQGVHLPSAEAAQQVPLAPLPLARPLFRLAFLDGLARHLARRGALGARAGLDGGLVQRHAAHVQHGAGGQQVHHLRVQQALYGFLVDVGQQVARPQACLVGRAVGGHVLETTRHFVTGLHEQYYHSTVSIAVALTHN